VSADPQSQPCRPVVRNHDRWAAGRWSHASAAAARDVNAGSHSSVEAVTPRHILTR